MLKMIPFAADHVLGVRLEGEVSKQEYEQLNARMKRHLQTHEILSIYAEIPHVDDVPIDATLEDLIIAIKHWKQVTKKAVVTDMSCVKVLEPIADKLSPGIEVKVFEDGEKEAARNWVVA